MINAIRYRKQSLWSGGEWVKEYKKYDGVREAIKVEKEWVRKYRGDFGHTILTTGSGAMLCTVKESKGRVTADLRSYVAGREFLKREKTGG